TSRLIDSFVRDVRIGSTDGAEGPLLLTAALERHLRFLQDLVWVYVIKNPRLATQQYGQRKIIGYLFEVYLEAVKTRNLALVPALFRSEVRQLDKTAGSRPADIAEQETRVAADIVAHFTDHQAVLLHRRLVGAVPGSMTELLHG
ncbi:MAG TPA: hypothetical protein VFH27_01985, partial [Longimicrobiaceae bacterium]|nr:hypothetical protein [Longimicrobiaceae bacterium]